MTQPPSELASETQEKNTLRRLDSSELFAGDKKIEINHNGEVYRLQITRQNKLILTK